MKRLFATLALVSLCAIWSCRGPALPPPPEGADVRIGCEQ